MGPTYIHVFNSAKWDRLFKGCKMPNSICFLCILNSVKSNKLDQMSNAMFSISPKMSEKAKYRTAHACIKCHSSINLAYV